MKDQARVGSGCIGRGDPRYAELMRRDFNKRFAGNPDYVRLVGSADDVADALQEAVHSNLRFAVRSGGHCLEGFVTDPAVRVVIDMSLMSGVSYDSDMGAFAVEAGTTVGEVYRRLFLGWGVTIPAGESPELGVGGHILGGAFGFLCRQHGLAADHLYGVELVVVDQTGTAKRIVATREPSDPNRELWWAHTGGGGGNFGAVTRYWFRSPNAKGSDPARLLPGAPDSVVVCRASWNWNALSREDFTKLLRNFGAWCERNSSSDSRYVGLSSTLFLMRRQAGKVELKALSTAGPDAERHLDEHLAAVTDRVEAPHTKQIESLSWLGFALNPFPELFKPVSGGALFKGKDAFLRSRFTDRQMDVAYDYLTRTDHDVPGGMLGLVTYGGMVNTVSPDATASVQRNSILSSSYSAGWGDPRDEPRSLAWVRAFYREMFADSGGVPAPGAAYEGTMINHPDVDLADPEWNTSGVPWHTLYYNDGYPRLQRVKSRWDPLHLFRHALSIRPLPPAPKQEGANSI